MEKFKYQHARASGYTPAQAVAYMRGARLPCRSYGVLSIEIDAQRTARLVRRATALAQAMGGSRWAWDTAWHEVRHSARRMAQPQPLPEADTAPAPARVSTELQFYYTTA